MNEQENLKLDNANSDEKLMCPRCGKSIDNRWPFCPYCKFDLSGKNKKTNIKNILGKHKLIFAVAAIFLIIVFIANFSSSSDGLEYVFDDYNKCYVVTGIGTCKDKKIVIPKKYNDFPVQTIGEDAFLENEFIQTVVIPDSVTLIDERAFSKCIKLEKVVIKEGTEFIGKEAFSGCIKLKSVRLPDSITKISEYAFYECEKLESIDIPKKIKTLPNGIFTKCTSLKKISIPDGVETIGESAFYGCSKLKTVSFSNDIVAIETGAFRSCTSIKKISLPKNLNTIGDYAFENCTDLVEISIGKYVTDIGYGTFEDCTSLKKINYGGSSSNWESIQKEYPQQIDYLMELYYKGYIYYDRVLEAMNGWNLQKEMRYMAYPVTVKCNDRSLQWNIYIEKQNNY
ncbi:MAG: leucine-rich repeat protein [Clostridia bacterium]|nr:leucine-rich repeat protein [Clostridia bacterium]